VRVIYVSVSCVSTVSDPVEILGVSSISVVSVLQIALIAESLCAQDVRWNGGNPVIHDAIDVNFTL
jgi:hypothetical protein